MRFKLILLNLGIFAGTFLVVVGAAYVLGLKVLFRAPAEIRQEGMWLRAQHHASDADELRDAREAIVDLEHGFARYEVAAIDAQLAVIDEPTAETEAFRRFCQALSWETCDKERVREALRMLFTTGEP